MASRDPFTDPPFVALQDPLYLSLRGREPVPGGCEPHGPVRLSPHRGEQEGSCGARSLRFPHRVTDPRGEGECRSPAWAEGQLDGTRFRTPRVAPG